MKTKDKQPSLDRRRFLITVGAGSAGAAAAIVGGTATEVAEPIAATETGKSQGYTATAHVRNYYRTTRV